MPHRMPKGTARITPDRSPGGCGAGHHGAGRDHPGNRQVDLAEQDDEHHAGGDDAEECSHLELQEQVFG